MQSNLDWLIDLVPDAALLVSPDQRIVAANRRADALFGATDGGLAGLALDALVPAEVRHAHQGYVERFFRQEHCRAMGGGLRFDGQRLDGSTIPVSIMLNQVQIEGQPYTIASVRDDSDRLAIQRMRDELGATNARLLRAQEVGGMGWWEFNNDSSQLTWSPMVPRLMGLDDATEPSLARLAEICLEEDRASLLALHRSPIDAPGQQLTYRIRRPDGEIRWIQETVDPAQHHRVLGVMRDITAEKDLEERLRRESVNDELTGLYNRKQFNRDLKARYAEWVRHERNTALIMYDFDWFKHINDCHGHQMGDQVLSQSADIVTAQLRPSDRVYRLGGEEFAILLPDTSLEQAEQLAERVRGSLEQARFQSGDIIVRATASLGISHFRKSDCNFEEGLSRADAALYQSKSRSRNTISVSG